MKIFAVALVLLVVKGTQGGVIPQDESKSNKSVPWQQPFWDLFNIGNDIARVAVEILSQSEIAKSAIANLSNTNGRLDAFFEESVQELSSLMKELKWKGDPISNHIIVQAGVVHDKLTSAGQQLHDAIGNETSDAIHEKLEALRKDILHYSQNLSLITEQFNQTYEDVTHQLEEWHKKATPYTEALRERITKQLEELRKYLSPVAHDAKAQVKKLLTKLSEAPLPTAAP